MEILIPLMGKEVLSEPVFQPLFKDSTLLSTVHICLFNQTLSMARP